MTTRKYFGSSSKISNWNGAPAALTSLKSGTRQPAAAGAEWPPAPADPITPYCEHLLAAPWALEVPLLLPPGRIGADAQSRHWWQAGAAALPLETAAAPLALGAELAASCGIWTGARLGLIAAQSNWGRLDFHG